MAEKDQITDHDIYAVVDKVVKNFLPLDQYSRLRVYRTIGTLFDLEDSFPRVAGNVDSQVTGNISREPQFSRPEEPTPKEFMLQKRPNTIVERVACLAYYLAHYRDIRYFKNTDINKLNTEAAQIKLSNVSYAVKDTVRSGLITAATKDLKQLTAPGEQYVEALPDRAAAKEVKPQAAKRSRRKTRTNQVENDHDQKQISPDE